MSSQTYGDRDELLRQLGYLSYTEYLASPLWVAIRTRAFKQRGYDCCLCGDRAACLHHRGYGRDVLLGTNLAPLVPICRRCHEKVEFKKSGKKRTLKEVEKRFNSLFKWAGKKSKQRKSFKQCKFPGCQNISKRGKMYCTPCEKKEMENTRLIGVFKEWLERKKSGKTGGTA